MIRSHSKIMVCPICSGHGVILKQNMIDYKFEEWKETCYYCKGVGMVKKTKTVIIEFEPFEQKK